MNPTAAVQAENLSKRYRLGTASDRPQTVKEAMGRTARRLVQRVTSRGHRGEANEIWALENVSFQVSRGDVVGIVGRNGAGKSTLLKILSRITEPTSGRAIIRGRVASLLEVGIGFQGDLTGRDNVYLNGAILGMKRTEIRRKFEEIVAFAELERFIDTPVKHYSTGMYMRLAFAVAAHLEPEILIVDEVLAVGDIAFQKKCLGRMKDVAGEGRTVLFVSHNMQAIRQLCHTAIWLEKGGIREQGSSELITEKYVVTADTEHAGESIQNLIARLPPDPLLRLLDISVGQDGRPTRSILSGRPVDVVVVFETRQESVGLHVYLRLFDMDGTMLLESIHNGTDSELAPLQRGTWRISGRIPAEFLAPRRYVLQVGVAIAHGRYVLPEPFAVTLDVTASGAVNRRYPGYVSPARLAPLFDWSVEEISR